MEAGPESLSPFAPPRSHVRTCSPARWPRRRRGEAEENGRLSLCPARAGGRFPPRVGTPAKRVCSPGRRGPVVESVKRCLVHSHTHPARPLVFGHLAQVFSGLPCWHPWPGRPLLTPDLASFPTSACTIPFFLKPLYLKWAFDHFAPKLQTRNPGTDSLPASSQSRRKAGSGEFQP